MKWAFVRMPSLQVVIKPSFLGYIQRTCGKFVEKKHPDIMFLSPYAEVLFTSQAGARRLVRKLREHGIKKNDDHQLSFREVMNHTVGTFRPFLFRKNELKPWKQGRRTNMGDIHSTTAMTWAEMALLRLVSNPAPGCTASSPIRWLHAFGGPWNQSRA